jgi:hypothetical protein
MKTIIIHLIVAFALVTAVTGCRKDEKESGKEAVREFLAEEDAKARDRHKHFMRGWGKGQSYPANPFGNDPKPTTPPQSPGKPAEKPGGAQPPAPPAPAQPAPQER